jgi:hypothetical protein
VWHLSIAAPSHPVRTNMLGARGRHRRVLLPSSGCKQVGTTLLGISPRAVIQAGCKVELDIVLQSRARG